MLIRDQFGIFQNLQSWFILRNISFQENGETNRKSSSMSSTLASKLFEVFSFNSNSRIRFVIIMVFRVIGFPGRCIRNIQGSHWRNSVRTCRHTYTVLQMFMQLLFWARNQNNHQKGLIIWPMDRRVLADFWVPKG